MKKELDIFDGSPPCASFSTAGKRDKHWGKVKIYSNRKQRTDDLFFEYIRFLKVIQPKVFVTENVSGLVKGKAKGYFLEILKGLKQCGYNVKAKLMNAKYYQVPQSRERLIFIGVRNDLNIEPNYPIPNNKIITCYQAIKDVKNNNQNLAETNMSKYRIYNEAIKLKQGEGSKKYFNLVKQPKNRPSFVITQLGGILGAASVIHWDNRKFTIKELKKLTTFPNNFILVGTFREQWEACGRAVPPKFMQAIAENIKVNILDKYYKN